MSDSDDSDNEQMKMVMEAVDMGFLSDNLFEETSKNKEQSAVPHTPKETPQISQRYLTTEDEVNCVDLQIPESMQTFIGKKLSELIEKKYKFVDISENTESTRTKHKWPKNRVLLLRGFETPVQYIWEVPDEPTRPVGDRPAIKRRIVEPDNLEEADRLQQACVDYELIQSGGEVKSWAKRVHNEKLFRYKCGKGGTLHFVEPENEFYKLRKKNCWSEKKISRSLKSKKNVT